jgi:hypothetical protein
VGTTVSAHTGASGERGGHRSQMQVAGAPRAVARASRVLWTVQRARGQARERRSRDFGWVGTWQGWHNVREEVELRVPNPSQPTAQASRKLGALLPLDVQHTTSSGARWGFEAERVKLAWSTGIRKHTSAQRRQGSGAGTWLVGGFEFGYLLQCGGGGAGREACNVPLGWTTGSSSLLAGVLLRLGRIAGQDFEGSSSSRSQLRHMTV